MLLPKLYARKAGWFREFFRCHVFFGCFKLESLIFVMFHCVLRVKIKLGPRFIHGGVGWRLPRNIKMSSHWLHNPHKNSVTRQWKNWHQVNYNYFSLDFSGIFKKNTVQNAFKICFFLVKIVAEIIGGFLRQNLLFTLKSAQITWIFKVFRFNEWKRSLSEELFCGLQQLMLFWRRFQKVPSLVALQRKGHLGKPSVC